MRFPRFTLRRLMVIVAVAGLALGIEMGRRRRHALLEVAKIHRFHMMTYREASERDALFAQVMREQAENLGKESPENVAESHSKNQGAEENERLARAYRTVADHFDRMQEKYRRAARFPFLPVEPDPLAPPLPEE
jgi:hypothetical protein